METAPQYGPDEGPDDTDLALTDHLAQHTDTLEGADRAEWLAYRALGIGASEAAVLLGCSPWQTELGLWGIKTGALEESAEDSERQRWGRLLEPVLRQEYIARTGHRVYYPGPWAVQRSRRDLLMLASLDGLVFDRTEPEPGVLECKCAESDRAWGDEPPSHHLAQVQWAMRVCGAAWADVAVLFGGNRFEVIRVRRRDELTDLLPALALRFWTHVAERRMPPVDGSEITRRALAALYARDLTGVVRDVGPGLLDLDRDRQRAKAELEGAVERVEQIDNLLKASIGDDHGIRHGAISYTWRTQARASYVAKATTFRVLLRHEFTPKGTPRPKRPALPAPGGAA